MTRKKALELIRKLKEISDGKDFVLDIMTHLNTDSDIQIVLDYIETAEELSCERITILAKTINENKE